MCLEQFFVNPRALQGFREGPLASLLDGFCQWLDGHGFSRETIRCHISRVSHFNRYLKQIGLSDYSSLNSVHVDAFLGDYLRRCKYGRTGTFRQKRIAFSIHRFMEYLQECGFVDTSSINTVPYQSLLDEYLNWLECYHNVAPGTLALRRQYLIYFLDWLGSDATSERLSSLSHGRIQTFFLTYSANRGRSARRSMQVTLRTFFRFCLAQGYVTRDFSQAVPSLRTYRLDRLPRGIEDEDGQRLLSNINRNTDSGRRDYAIIQMLYTYGVRGGQIRALRLGDINWKESQIRFSALKHGKECLLPLTNNVAESLLDYLQHSRPETPYSEVFLTSRAPYRPLRYSTTLSEITARRMRALGINPPTFGAHAFRHCFASRMLKQGQSLKSIADMIGHRCIQTTFTYTKVDFQTLNQVALDWPEEEL